MEHMTKRKVAELYWSSIRLYQIFHARGLYPRQHVGRHSKRNDPKDMSKIIAKSMRAIYNCCQASLGGGGGQGKRRKRLNICLGKWQRRWYIWIFLKFLYYYCYNYLIIVWASGNGGDVLFLDLVCSDSLSLNKVRKQDCLFCPIQNEVWWIFSQVEMGVGTIFFKAIFNDLRIGRQIPRQLQLRRLRHLHLHSLREQRQWKWFS